MGYRNSTLLPVRIIVILLSIMGTILAGIIIWRVPQLKAESVRIKALRGSLEAEEAVLTHDMAVVRQQAIETILSEQFTPEQLRGILGEKLYTYELRINGTKINRSNVQFNSTDSFVEITVTEFMMPNSFSSKLIEDFSLMNSSSVSIHSTSSTCTSEVRCLADRTVICYSFPKIEVGEIITILVNNPDLTAALDLERNVIEITHTSMKTAS